MDESNPAASRFRALTNPTGKHKDWYRLDYIRALCAGINPSDSLFDSKKFIADYRGAYKNLELKARMSLIADLLDAHLDCAYKRQLKILSRLMGAPLDSEVGMFTSGFYLYPLSQFVEKFAERNLEDSLKFIYELTQRFTGEWAIRTVANADKALTLKTMRAWSKDKNFHVRRLASEGLRLRLPWGKKIDWVEHDPSKVLPIYNKLRNDTVLYVRRSVANSMGDLIKIHDDLAYECFETWLVQKITKENLWVIKHAIRTPVKKGNARYRNLKARVESLTQEL